MSGKFGKLAKDYIYRDAKNRLLGSKDIFFANFYGLSSNEISALRKTLVKSGSRLFVTKNVLVKKILAELKIEGVDYAIEGMCGLILAGDDPIVVSKTLVTFAKDHEALKLRAALIERKVVTVENIKVLAKIPGRKELLAMLAFSINAPISKVAFALSSIMQKTAVAINEIKEKRGGTKNE